MRPALVTDAGDTAAPVDERTAPRRRFRYPRHLPLVSATLLAIWVLAALIGPLVWGDEAEQIDLAQSLLPPCGFGDCQGHLLGTDQFGRDMFARLVVGARVALIIALASVLIAGTIGLAFGLVAGYVGGVADSILSRLADLALAFPVVLLALLFAVQFGASLRGVVLIIVILLWGRFARVARAETLVLKELGFVESARAQGASTARIMAVHVLPNVLPAILVLATLQMGWAILTEAALSFLGAGVPPPAPAWGSMVAEGRDLLETSWWVPILPGIAILLVTVTVNVFGDWLRDRLDPQQL